MTSPDVTNMLPEDAGGQSLDQFCGSPMELGRFLQLAIGIAKALAGLHGQGIIHKNITPRTILFNPHNNGVTITGFSPASDVSYQHPTFKASGKIEGTLAYMSPEQTGRMNRVVDHRSDLYSLGMTFHEMLTGTLPFSPRDALEWFHCHIARMPRPVTELVPSIPEVVSNIVMKLLAKTAEERYQTALGLRSDLERCLEQWETKREIDRFALGEGDISDRLLIPQRLYGREKDFEDLLSAFHRVVERGAPELIMVAGYSGIGKTALVRELHVPIIREHGLFISGKFDQHKHNIPYSTIVEAFQELIRQILAENEERIADWRKQLQNALGVNGQLIVEIIPQAELILGKQPPVPELPLNEAENRFNMVFRQFTGVFARKEHPLVVFLDDLQWVDSASLKLLEHIITFPDTKHLLLIGAYRENEVNDSHPLMLTLDNVRLGRPTLRTITLSPLSFADLRKFMADTFHSNHQEVEGLTKLVYEKTAGNPFFVIQFLMTLHGENLIELDRMERRWKWDVARIQTKSYTDNVVDLMAGKLRKLTTDTQQVLRLAACIGNKFDLHTLAVIGNILDDEAQGALWGALREGLVLRLAESSYTFLHDRVQQAAYWLIPQEQRPAMHLDIGRLLLQRTPPGKVEEQVFDIVNQFNLGLALIFEQGEKYRVAELNLIAGKKAKASTAYKSALSYLILGAQLLDDAAWEAFYDLTFDLYREFAVVEYLNGNYAHSKELINLLLTKARSDIEKAELYDILIVQYTMTAQYAEAIEIGRTALRLLKVCLPEADLQEELNAQLAQMRAILGDRKIASLVDEPEMADPEKRVSVKLLANIMVPARYSDNLLFALITVIMVNLSLRFGPISKSPVGYSAMGMLLGFKNNYREGYEFGELALKLCERFNDLAQKCRACFVLGNYLNHWVKHLKWADDFNNDAYQAGLASGEMQWTGYTLAYKLFQPFYRGMRIDLIQKEIPDLLSFTQKTKNQWATDTLLGIQRALSALRPQYGEEISSISESSSCLQLIAENEYLGKCREHRSSGAIGRYAVLNAQILYMYDRMEEALGAILIAKELLEFFSSSISVAEHNFYYSLVLAALYGDVIEEKQAEYLQTIRSNQEQMKIWAANCEENFKHQYLLVEAEIARITGEELKAERLYEQAIKSARESEFVQNEGLANELASRFYFHRGFETIAEAYLRQALACYVRWGADGKIRQLHQKWPRLMEEECAGVNRGLSAQIGQLEAITVIKASQAISGEIVLSNLLERLMRTVIENAGAQKGCLLMVRGYKLVIEAEARVVGQQITVVLGARSQPASVLPLSMVNYVKRTRESVILDDTSSQDRFASDPYILKEKPISVLCLPLLRQTSLIGVLYLENSLVKGAFTTDRIAILELLAAQATISLENAILYLERSRAEEALRESEEKYRAIFENSGTAMVFIEEDTVISMCNKEFEKLSGYLKAEVEGKKNWTHFVSKPEDLQRMEEYHRLRRIDPQSAPRTYEYKLIDRNGEVKDLVATVTMMPGMKQSLAVLLDITGRKRVEEERTRLATAIEQAAEGFLVLDKNWIVRYVNPAFERNTGYSKSEIIGQHARILKTDKYDRMFYKEIRDTLTSGEVWSGRAFSRRKDGTFYEVEVTASPVRNKSGDIINYVGTHRDITREVKLERELRQAQKMEAIGTLAGGIAHDFNNILTAMMGAAQMALYKAQEQSPLRRYLEQILQSGGRAGDLVRQILTFSRKAEQDRKPVQAVLIVNEALKLLRSSLPSTIEIRQEFEVLSEGGLILGDPTEIHQVLMNLGTNAAHAMRSKGGLLSVRLSNIMVDGALVSRYRDLQPGPYLCLTVSDTGHGMDAAIMERIFDPYFTTKEPGEGTGMGLAVVQGIVKSHGGAITVYSEPGQGTTFNIFLPQIEGRSVPMAEAIETLPGGGERILFVDDEQVITDLGQEMLESLGYHITTHTSSLKALEAFKAEPDSFDLVITDMTMPDLTGKELAKELMAIRPDIPIILCTGFSELVNGKKAKETGIREFVMKPYAVISLAKTIRKVLDEG